MYLAAHIVSHTENTSSYRSSGERKKRKLHKVKQYYTLRICHRTDAMMKGTKRKLHKVKQHYTIKIILTWRKTPKLDLPVSRQGQRQTIMTQIYCSSLQLSWFWSLVKNIEQFLWNCTAKQWTKHKMGLIDEQSIKINSDLFWSLTGTIDSRSRNVCSLHGDACVQRVQHLESEIEFLLKGNSIKIMGEGM